MQWPILHLRRTRCNAGPKRYVRAMFYCSHGNNLEEVQIAPHATFFASTKSPSDMVSCRQDTTPSADHTRRWNDTNRESILWTNYWYRFSAGQGQLMKILIYFWWAAKTIAGSYMRVTMGKLMVWALKLDPSFHQDNKWKPTSRAFDWCNNNGGIPL